MNNKKDRGKFLKGFAVIYICSVTFFSLGLIKEKNLDLQLSQLLTPSGISAMCIASYYPSLREGTMESVFEDGAAERKNTNPHENDEIELIDSDENEKITPKEFGKEPVVLIVHTHATESYLPTSSGNYHSKEKENTVREVGEVLAKELKKNGISAVHDETLHDSPSYSNSYSRSYDTTSKLLKKYPSVICVIDLHRDAISSDEHAPKVSSMGKKCAKYSYVVSNSVDTYKENIKFIKGLNKIAKNKEYDSFTGKIIERGYKYNQELSSKYMLLEIGYNTNHIDEAKNTAKVFAKILSKGLKTL